MNPIKKILERSKKIPEEDKLREEIRKRFPELDLKDEDEMIIISRETGINNVEALREMLIERKAERERKSKNENIVVDPGLLKESWSTFQRDLQKIKNANIPEEKKRMFRKIAYREHLRRIGVLEEEKPKKAIVPYTPHLPVPVSEEEKPKKAIVPYTPHLPVPVSEEESKKAEYEEYETKENIDPELVRKSWSIFQRELQEIKNMNIPEEEKRILRKMAYRDHLKRIGVEKEIQSTEKDRFEKLKRIISWPFHKIEPEENRLSRAIARGKRRLDHIARTKNKEIVLKHKIKKIREYAETIKIKEMKELVEKLRKEVKKLEEELKKEKEKAKQGKSKIQMLEILEKDIERKMKELEEAEKKYNDLKNKLDSFIKENAKESIVLKEILRSESYNVLEEIKQTYNIKEEKNILIIENSLLKFADAEAEKMVQDNYKTIYQSAKGFFLSDIYTPIEETSKYLYGFTESIFQFILDFIFSPIVIGIIILWLLFSIFLNYIITGPTLAVLIITMIITILVSLGKVWKLFYEFYETKT